MNSNYAIPPLRDLPPGRLGLRAQNLRATIAEEPRSRFALTRLGIGVRRLAPVVLVALAVLAALALVPIGASLASRALDGVSGLWRSGQLPPAPRPYQPGDQVWTQEEVPQPSSGRVFHRPAAYTPPLLPHLQAPPPYHPGYKVWTTEPPQNRVAITISCPNGIDDAARKLAELERQGSSVNEVDCR
jgi:hypothetical protein